MKDKKIAGLLALFFGGLGLHKFYLDKTGWGIIYFLMSWTFIPSFLGIIEGIDYIFSTPERFDRQFNKGRINGLGMISSVDGAKMTPAQELTKLADLVEKGFLTKEEFEKQKSEILKNG